MGAMTYTTGSADVSIEGNGWDAMRWHKKDDNSRVDSIWHFIGIVNHGRYEFDHLCDHLDVLMEHHHSRGRVDIYRHHDKGIYEVNGRGVFPRILIKKRE